MINSYPDPTREEVIAAIRKAAAQAFFASAYADAWEQAGDDTINPSGRDWMDLTPDEIDPAATHAAQTLAKRPVQIPSEGAVYFLGDLLTLSTGTTGAQRWKRRSLTTNCGN
ncbi:hypothetical protein ACQUFY_05745 [Robbsia andropogonis]|uniref:hypothetical protein n=1 Tax=Robbsia andropogonis TaxID=28092 RepID=UPI003D24F5EF